MTRSARFEVHLLRIASTSTALVFNPALAGRSPCDRLRSGGLSIGGPASQWGTPGLRRLVERPGEGRAHDLLLNRHIWVIVRPKLKDEEVGDRESLAWIGGGEVQKNRSSTRLGLR